MPLKWINIRSGLKTVAETEPQISALWSSSDHSPNITQGQDMGWRLAPEVVVEMKKIKQDLPTLERIAARFGKSVDDLNEPDILTYISNKTTLDAAPQPDANDFEDSYDAEIRALEGKVPVVPLAELTVEELQAELEARQSSTTTTTKK